MFGEFLNGSTFNRSEVFAGSRHLATFANNTNYFVHSDWLGTVRALSSSTGTSFGACTSLAFGDALTCTGGSPGPNHFTDQIRDSDGLDFMNARHYGSGFGRFMTPDPVGFSVADASDPQSWNLYAYTESNPINFMDPSGLCRQNDPNPQCHGVHCLNPMAGCIGGPGCFDGISGNNCNNPNDPNSPSCTIDGVAASCGTALGILAAGGGVVNHGGPTLLPGGGAVIVNGDCVSATLGGQSLGSTCGMTSVSVLGGSGGGSYWGTFIKSFVQDFSVTTARRAGESRAACFGRTQDALLGRTGSAVLATVATGGLLNAGLTAQLWRYYIPGTAGTAYAKVSVIEALAEESGASGATMVGLDAGTKIASRVGGYVTLGALTLEGAFGLACAF